MSDSTLHTADGRAFFTITELGEARFFVNDLFKRKFASDAPEIPRNFVAFYKDMEGALHVAGFSHMLRWRTCYLSGGSCSDGNTLRRMSEEERSDLRRHMRDAARGAYREEPGRKPQR